jgi:D-threo-aldose 1-dehydrogenase
MLAGCGSGSGSSSGSASSSGQSSSSGPVKIGVDLTYNNTAFWSAYINYQHQYAKQLHIKLLGPLLSAASASLQNQQVVKEFSYPGGPACAPITRSDAARPAGGHRARDHPDGFRRRAHWRPVRAVSEDAARATLETAWTCGVRAFDTAPHCGAGLSEQRLGEFLGGKPRTEFVISTKVGRRLVAADADADLDGVERFYGTPRLTRVRDYSRDGVLASLEDSLTRLGLDRIDVALIHDPDDHAGTALDGAFPALAELRAAGVIGAIGVGMNQAPMLEWFVARADLDCVLVAGRYSLLDGQAAATLFPACQRRGVAVLAAGVFNSGLLARPVAGATSEYAPAPAALLDRARRIAAVCARHETDIGAAAVQFALAHPAVTAAVVGARSRPR